MAEADFTVTPAQWDTKQIYYLHASIVTPRPIAWVGTVSADGKDNLAPHSYFNAIADDPPYLMFSIEGETDTYRNLLEVPEFTVSVVTEEMAERMELSAASMPRGESEFDWAQVERGASIDIRPPRVAQSPASMECRVDRIIDVGRRNHVVIGAVVRYHIMGSVWRNGRVSPERLKPLCRLGGRYATLAATFKMPRPGWEDIRGHSGDPEKLVSRLFD
ncbi:flavin reductase family protein [Mesorhizobium sp. CA8]|uniref:flavin reductase family protein n=1 Tax=unclassified Mesorhizobium TaxID=325217 RepID=UPI001CCEF5FC|nr:MULTISPECIES: flavin reductase family protein [unclassified Mesorhizobium]MBZ9761667.1 flavin reductase family protein [Mesorhizobium sp. CA8]MBZ9820579.1 flavin reductase family protein [Mesorhizobium sp. CA4]